MLTQGSSSSAKKLKTKANIEIGSMLLFMGPVGLWWHSQNSENQRFIIRELMLWGIIWNCSIVIEFQQQGGSWYSMHLLLYTYRNSGLALSEHLFGGLYSDCVVFGTSFHSHSKSNEKTEIHKDKQFAYSHSRCLLKQNRGLNFFFLPCHIVFFPLLSTANCILSRMETYSRSGVFFKRILDRSMKR